MIIKIYIENRMMHFILPDDHVIWDYINTSKTVLHRKLNMTGHAFPKRIVGQMTYFISEHWHEITRGETLIFEKVNVK